MSDEDGFLRAIVADPGNVALRLIYADWLEERGDADADHRAEYLRAECALDALPARNRRRRRLQARLRELRPLVGADWWRQLDWSRVEFCVEFQFRCPQRWDKLSPTNNAAVRQCQSCQQKVYYCRSVGEAHRRADAGQCVAIDSRLARLPLGMVRTSGRRLGKVMPRVPSRLPLNQRGRTSRQG